MNKRIVALAATLILVGVGSISASSVAAAGDFQRESTIAFSSNRDDLTGNLQLTAEIYLIDPDGTNPRRLTENAYGDGFANLSPDGKKIIFDSNRLTAGTLCGGTARLNISDLFLMNSNGTDQTLLTRGSSATWSPDGTTIAFHASASYYASDGLETGCPTRPDVGSPTTDSDIFAVNVDDLQAGVEQPTNITNSPNKIDDDPDWSPDGQSIAYTAHNFGDEGPKYPNPPFISNSGEIYVVSADGMGVPERLTFNTEEERAPAWSPDGSHIAFMCRIGGGTADFELCVMNADGSDRIVLTDATQTDATPTWLPDGEHIVFHRIGGGASQLFVINATLNTDGTFPTPTQLTFPPGFNSLAHAGVLRVKVDA